MRATFTHRIFRFSGRHAIVVAWLVLFLALGLQYYFKVRHGSLENRSAILRWQNQVLAMFQGTDIWQKYHYPNPPIMALVLAPVMKLPPLACSLTWFYLKALMSLAAICWVFRMVETPDKPMPTWGKILAIVLSLRPILGDLTHGNVNLFILFLVVASLYAFTRGKHFTAGLVLALSIACKVTPALFIPYFLWKRAWRTLAGCALGLVLFLLVIPGLYLGMGQNFIFLTSWTEKMVRPFVVDGDVMSELTNQSLPGLVNRLGQHTPSFTTYTPHGYVPTEYHNILNLNQNIISWFIKGCMALFALLVVWSCKTSLSSKDGWPLLAEFGLVVLGMLLFSERTWKHHCVTLLLPFTVIAYYLSACRPDKTMKRYLVGTLVAAAVLMATTSTIPGLERFGKLAQVYGAYVWAYFTLIAALLILLRRQATVPEKSTCVADSP